MSGSRKTRAQRVLLLSEGSSAAERVHEQLSSLARFEVESVSIDEGLERLASRSYAAIVLDLSELGGAWRDAVKRTRSTAASTPLVVSGSSGEESMVRQVLRLGAEEYVGRRSADAGALRRAILSAIERKTMAVEAHDTDREPIRALLDAIPDAICRIHRSGRTHYLKPAGIGAFSSRGASPQPDEQLLPRQLIENHGHRIEAALGGGAQTLQCQLAVEESAPRHYEVRLVRSGRDEVLAIFRDVTAGRRLEEQVKLSQRLEAVGRLAGGLAHDFNNILTVIMGNAVLALTDETLTQESRLALEDINSTAERAATLTLQLLAFSRKQILKMVPVDLNASVSETVEMLRRLIGEDIAIETKLSSESSTVRADPAQIEQALMNLAVNARDAMPRGGKLLIETEDAELDEDHFGDDIEIASGTYVLLAVSDTGVGMEAGTRERAFEPFFTTKERGKGTGLGLSSVYGIVKQSGGYVWLYSELGMGTTVKIYLPSVDSEAATKVEREPASTGNGRGERILLVEDDPTVLEIARRFLADGGYRVIPASGIESALRMVENPSEPIDLLATDVVLPGMNGRDLSKRLHSLRPGIKTLYISGYTEDAIAHHGVLEPGVAFLQKPYSREELLEAVRRALDAGDRVDA